MTLGDFVSLDRLYNVMSHVLLFSVYSFTCKREIAGEITWIEDGLILVGHGIVGDVFAFL